MSDSSVPTSAPSRAELLGAAESLGVDLDPTQATSLLRFLDLLQRWNGVYNLTAVRDPRAMFTHHLLDCLAAVRPLRRELQGRRASHVSDVGSGGGLPGAVLAVALPEVRVTCIDSVAKKVAFVRQVAAELRLTNLETLHARVETVTTGKADVVTSRAFSTLSDFIDATRGLRRADGVWMAMKGRIPEDEIAAVPSDTRVFHVEPIEIPGLDAQRCLVWMQPAP
jgi:16S rRNA (guanine527-N7)-methyltransferase